MGGRSSSVIFRLSKASIMRLLLTSVAALCLLSAGSGCASYCCDSYCGTSCCSMSSCGGPACGPMMGNCCDQWMDGTDACVDVFCQQNSRVKGLLKESYHCSRQTLKDLYNPPPPEFCVGSSGPNPCGPMQCGASRCGAGQCGAGNCQECEQFGPPEPPCGCGSTKKCRKDRRLFQMDCLSWRPKWKPSWKFPWKKQKGCDSCGETCSCGASGQCGASGCGAGGSCTNCATGHHDHPAGYASSVNQEMPNQGEFAFGPRAESPENYFIPPTNHGAQRFGGTEQYGSTEMYHPQQPVPPMNAGQPFAPQPYSPEYAGPQYTGQQYSGPQYTGPQSGTTQQLPNPLPEGSPRARPWRAVSSYRESFPAPPAADMESPAPLTTPSKVLTPPYDEEGDEFMPPLIIESK